MTDISKEAVADLAGRAEAWEEVNLFQGRDRQSGDMSKISATLRAQAARIEELEAALMAIHATVAEIRALMKKEPNT